MIIISPIIRSVGKIASLVLYAITLLAAFGGYVNPDIIAIPAVLTLGLQYLAIITFIVAVLWLVSGRLIIGALGIITILIGWSGIGAAIPLSFPNKAPDNATRLTILTFNSLHLEDISKPDSEGNRSVDFLIKSGADIICLQEVEDWNDFKELKKLTKEHRDSLFALYPYKAGKNGGKSDLKVLSKYPIKVIEEVAGFSQYASNRFLLYKVNVKGNLLYLVNMHLTSYNLTEEERKIITDVHGARTAKKSIKEFKATIFNKLQHSFQGRADNVDDLIAATKNISAPIIVCGDFNDVPASWSYRKMRNAGFEDAYSETNFWPTFTYNQHLFLFHLDQIFYRGSIQPLWVKKEHINTSDHYPLMAEFAFL